MGAETVQHLTVLAMRPDGFLDCQHCDFANMAETPGEYGFVYAAPLLDAVAEGALQAAFIVPGEMLPSLKKSYQDRRPHLVLFRDTETERGGPADFPLAGAVMRWGYAVTICTGPMDQERSDFILAFANRRQRAVAVVTTPERAEAWADFAATADFSRPLRCITLRPGDPLPSLSAVSRFGGPKEARQ